MNIQTNQSVAWDAVAGAIDYQVELSQLSGAVDRTVTTAETHVLASVLFEGIALGVSNRRVRVRARDAFGDGAWSSFLSPLTLVGLPAPTNLRIE